MVEKKGIFFANWTSKSKTICFKIKSLFWYALIEIVKQYLDQVFYSYSIFVGLQKAFYIVDHEILLMKFSLRKRKKLVLLLPRKLKGICVDISIFFFRYHNSLLWCTTRFYIKAIIIFILHYKFSKCFDIVWFTILLMDLLCDYYKDIKTKQKN